MWKSSKQFIMPIGSVNLYLKFVLVCPIIFITREVFVMLTSYELRPRKNSTIIASVNYKVTTLAGAQRRKGVSLGRASSPGLATVLRKRLAL